MSNKESLFNTQLHSQESIHPAELPLINASEQLIETGKNQALSWINHVIKTNPTYTNNVTRHDLNIDSIEKLTDLPLIDKTFIRGKSIAELCPDQEDMYGVSGSSGMTGEPIWIPRRKSADAGILPAVESLFTDNWDIDTKPTTTITSWSLGMWVAGTLMVEIGNTLAKTKTEAGASKHQFIAVHPGSNLKETVQMINQMQSLNRQIILQAYPPFAAEVMQALKEQGQDLPSLNLNLFIAGEPMSEPWRIGMQKQLAGENGESDLSRVISLYGTAEGGVMGFETKLSVLIRKLAHHNPELRKVLFGSSEGTPMLFQYPVTSKWIESVNDEIVFTGKTGLPSIRYNMHDHGGIVTFKDMFHLLHEHGYNPLQTLTELGYGQKLKNVAPLPFVYVFGRKDGGISIDGGNVYPTDADALLEHPTSQQWGIQEYMLGIHESETGQMRLKLHLQMKHNYSHLLAQKQQEELSIIAAQIIASNNPDYQKSLTDNPTATLPLIITHPHSDPLFSKNNTKFKRTRIQ
jgi:phenylacetate-CoA ligase